MRDTRSCWLYRHSADAALVASALFVIVALLVAARVTMGLDAYANSLAAGWRSIPGVTEAANIATTLGTAPFLIPVALAAALLVARQGRRSEMILPFLPLIVEWVTNPLIKGIFLRHRPTNEPWPPGLFGTDQYAFPSGHAMASLALYSLLACWAWAWWPGRGRLAVTLLMVLMPLAIGLSRVVLGVHWLSDVAGAWLAGLTVTSFVVLAWVRFRHNRDLGTGGP